MPQEIIEQETPFAKAHKEKRRNFAEDFYRNGMQEGFKGLHEFQRDRLNSVLDELPTASMRESAKAQYFNQTWFATTFDKKTEDVAEDWAAYKIGLSKQLNLPEMASEEALFGAIQGQVAESDKRRESVDAMMQEGYIAGVKKGGNWWDEFHAVALKLKQTEGYRVEDSGMYAKAYQEAFETAQKSVGERRGEFEKVFSHLAASQGIEGFDSELSKDDMLEAFDASTPEDFQQFAQYAAYRADELGLDKGFIKQSAEALGRGFSRIAEGHSRNIDRSRFLGAMSAIEAGKDIWIPVGKDGYGDDRSKARVFNWKLEDPRRTMVVPGNAPESAKQRLAESWRKATPEEKEQLKDDSEKWLNRLDIASKLTGIAEQAIDPIRGDWVGTEKAWYPFMENVAFTAQAFVPAAGLPMLFSSTYDMRYEEIRERQPHLSRDDVGKAALVSAAIEAPIERFLTKATLTAKLPSLTRMFKPMAGAGTSAIAKRFMAAFAVGAAENFAQERLQDGTPLVVGKVVEALNEDYPSTPWNEILTPYADSELDTFYAILPLALIGGLAATTRDVGIFKKLESQKSAMAALGLTDEWIEKVIAAKTPEAADTAIREGMKERNDGKIKAALAEFSNEAAKQWEEFEQRQADPDRPTIEQEGDRFDVYDAEFNKVAEANTFEEANDIVNQMEGHAQAQDKQAMLDAIGYIQEIQESGSSITFEDRKVTVDDMRKEGADADVERFIKASAGGDVTGQQQVFGYNEEAIREGVFSDVSKVFRGARPDTVIHEHGHSYFKRELHAGNITWDSVKAWKANTDPDSNRSDSEEDLHEWLAEQSVAYVTGRIDSETAQRWIPESVLKFFEKLRDYAMIVAIRAADLMALRESGKLDKGFEKHLARSVGLDEDHRMVKHEKAEADRVQREADRDTGENDPKNELLSVVKALGGIPTKDKALQGELDNLRQNFGGKWSSVARKSGKDLDTLTSDLRDKGFDFDTPSDLIDALDKASRGKQLFGKTFSVSTEQDAEYMKAVEAGDMETAQRMVDEAAKRAGYDTKGYHGSPDFVGDRFSREFLGRETGLSRGGFSFAPDRESAEAYMNSTVDPETGIVDAANKVVNKLADRDPMEKWEGPNGETWGVLKFNASNVDEHAEFADYLSELATSLDVRFPDLAQEMRSAAKTVEKTEGYPRIVEAWLMEPQEIDVHGRTALVLQDPNKIKSADPVTKDANGNVIPLSKRFDSNRKEITFAIDPAIQETLIEVEEDNRAKRRVAERVESGEHKGKRFDGKVIAGLKQSLYRRFSHKQAVDDAVVFLTESPEKAWFVAEHGTDDGKEVDPAVRVALYFGLAQAYSKSGNADMAVLAIDQMQVLMTTGGKIVSAGNIYSPLGLYGDALADPLFAQMYGQHTIKKAIEDIENGRDVNGTQGVLEDILGDEVRGRRKGKKRTKKEIKEEVKKGLKEKELDTWPKIEKAINKLYDMIEAGEISPATVGKVLRETWKLPKWNKAIENKVRGFSENIEALPEGSTLRDAEVVRFMSWLHDQIQGVDPVKMVWSMWYSNVLSGWRTSVRNVGDSGLNAAMMLMLQGIHWNPKVMARRGLSMFTGLKHAVSMATGEGWTTLATGESPIAGMNKYQEGDRDNLGIASEIERLDHIKNPFWRGVVKTLTINGITKITGRMMAAQDVFIGMTAGELRAFQLAADKGMSPEKVESLMALSEAHAADIKSTVDAEWEKASEHDKAVHEATGKHVLNVTEAQFRRRRTNELRRQARDGELNERSADFARRATYNYDPEGFLGIMVESLGALIKTGDEGMAKRIRDADGTLSKAGLWGIRAGMNLPRLVMPFVRIVANVSNVSLDYSPIGAVRAMQKQVRTKGKDKYRDKTIEEREIQIKRAVLGNTLVAVLAYGLWPDDDDDAAIKFHGRGPNKFSDSQALRGTGWIPWSIEIDGNYYSYRDTTIGGVLAWVGSLHDAKRYRKEKLESQEFWDRAAYGAFAFAGVQMDRSMLTGLADVVEILGRDEFSRGEAFKRWASRTLDPTTVVIPFKQAFNQVDQAFDDTRRGSDEIKGKLMAQIPIARRFNKPSLDILGDPIESRATSWLFSENIPEARLFQAMAKHQATPSDGWTYRRQMADADMYYEFQRIKGQYVKEKLERNIDSFERMTTEQAQEWMRKVSSRATKAAKQAVGFTETD